MTDAIPESTLPYPPVYKDKRFVVLSDWDGTITTQDSNDYMTDNLGFGKARRRAGNLEILAGRQTFSRDGFREMLESIAANGHSFDECKEVLKKNIKLDVGFKDFNAWCAANDIPVVIVSSGMAPSIRAVLSNLVGEEVADTIDIIANEVEIEDNGKWHINFRHPSSGYGHDKSRAILPYKDLESPPLLFFFGDGVSDMSAARHADVLFVKQKDDGENDLAAYCTREGIKHIIFRDFAQALRVVQAVVRGEKTPAEVLAAGKA
ncbi:HAD-like domain-containing protein [Mycena rosella]|uniref:HAD-like domain-containing protein n=1 Tax=Mycena rosella TaxID=1033263 RepID=A0AAD7D2V5_MYCRO|nr:HAD-like domain-containing protein [Mycena rosella]